MSRGLKGVTGSWKMRRGGVGAWFVRWVEEVADFRKCEVEREGKGEGGGVRVLSRGRAGTGIE